MKRSLEWHRECLENWERSLIGQRNDFARAKANLERSEAEFAFYAQQVEEAERRGMDAFDRDRLLVKREKVAQS